MPIPLVIRPDIALALREGHPVVALESTIISHGMPWPQNAETALRCEQAVREGGALPATIALLDGTLVVGLTQAQIETIARLGEAVVKTSRRDFGYVLSRKLAGATTVAGTMIACRLAGIRFFATGGIGGVHRGAEVTMDVSADLEELGKTPVCVVCAGVKSILDQAKTLEYLETRGVPVVGYQTEFLPSFFARTSPYRVPFRLENPESVAALAREHWNLGLDTGIIVANPVPEADAFDAELIEKAIREALTDMESEGVKGKDATPYLLKRINEITAGGSLKANIALVLNNCRLAAGIAKAYAEGEGIR
ncbi:MAG TPA: pseudouridine-5'-phosphate glycosidase [Bacillota bacterium]|nr:pseudouridine-5'-phosphate glycosidase [Bacillota bacterium]